jgi:hypothetical protein
MYVDSYGGGVWTLVVFTATMVKRYVYIGNLPSTATEEVLQELFPDCINMAVIVNGDGLPKGYCTCICNSAIFFIIFYGCKPSFVR